MKHCENGHAEKDQQRQKIVSGEKNKSRLGSTVFKRQKYQRSTAFKSDNNVTFDLTISVLCVPVCRMHVWKDTSHGVHMKVRGQPYDVSCVLPGLLGLQDGTLCYPSCWAISMSVNDAAVLYMRKWTIIKKRKRRVAICVWRWVEKGQKSEKERNASSSLRNVCIKFDFWQPTFSNSKS